MTIVAHSLPFHLSLFATHSLSHSDATYWLKCQALLPVTLHLQERIVGLTSTIGVIIIVIHNAYRTTASCFCLVEDVVLPFDMRGRIAVHSAAIKSTSTAIGRILCGRGVNEVDHETR